jgi:hypothetical protein
MNEILIDLKNAVNSIPEFYYTMPTVSVINDNLNIDNDESKYYERRFVAQLKSEYDKLINDGSTGNYKEVKTDFEVIKRYIYTQNPDRSIIATYEKLSKKNINKTFQTITTIPDFFIHKQQDNREEVFQKLAVEAKTTSQLDEDDFFLDLFKLNVYVEKYKFQNGVYLIANNNSNTAIQLAKSYLQQRLYLAPHNKDRIYLFIKPTFNSDIEIIKLIDL